jgi:hypothetical protein
MMLRGYRSSDSRLLSGPWLDGELAGLPLACWPALAEPSAVPPPSGPDEELCIAPGVGFVRYTELDWVHRRARVETGLQPGHADAAGPLLQAAVAYGLADLNLRKLHGWVTPATGVAAAAPDLAGFRLEASVPDGIWLEGRAVERQIWAVIRSD